MKCEELQDRLDEQGWNALPAAERGAAAAHLAHCASCRAVADEHQLLVRAFRELYAPRLPEALLRSVLAEARPQLANRHAPVLHPGFIAARFPGWAQMLMLAFVAMVGLLKLSSFWGKPEPRPVHVAIREKGPEAHLPPVDRSGGLPDKGAPPVATEQFFPRLHTGGMQLAWSREIGERALTHAGAPTHLACLSGYDATIVSSGKDRLLRVWQTWPNLKEASYIPVDPSFEINALAGGEKSQVFAATLAGVVGWDVKSGRRVQRGARDWYWGAGQELKGLMSSEDGRVLLVLGRMETWWMDTRTLNATPLPFVLDPKDPKALSRDGSYLACSIRHRDIEVWKLNPPTRVHTLRDTNYFRLLSFGQEPELLNGYYSSRRTRWNVVTGKEVELPGTYFAMPSHLVPSDRGSSNRIAVWDAARQEAVDLELRRGLGPVREAILGPANHWAVAIDDERMHWWELGRSPREYVYDIRQVVTGPNHNHVAAMGRHDFRVYETHEQGWWPYGSYGSYDVRPLVKFAPLSETLFVMRPDGENPATVPFGKYDGSRDKVGYYADYVSVSASGRYMVSRENNIVQMVDILHPHVVTSIPIQDRAVDCVLLSPTGRYVMVYGGTEVRLFTVSANVATLRWTYAVEGGARLVGAFSPDSRLLALSCGTNSVHVVNVADGRELHTVSSDANRVEAIRFLAPDCLATGGSDGRVRIHDLTGSGPTVELALPGTPDSITAFDLDVSQATLIVGTYLGRVHFIRITML